MHTVSQEIERAGLGEEAEPRVREGRDGNREN